MTYLSASELAELLGCRRNQKSRMIAWLTQQNWAYVIDVTGQPKVARAYHDKKNGHWRVRTPATALASNTPHV